jgi:hypothetical protein
MAETALSTTRADALSGTTDANFDFTYPAIGESTYYTTWFKLMHRLAKALEPLNEFRICQDGDLTFEVRGGKLSWDDNVYSYAGATAQALTDDDTTYIWVQVDSGVATLYTSLTSFPDPGTTPHLPLATVAVGSESTGAVSGTYDDRDIVDYRGRALWELVGEV